MRQIDVIDCQKAVLPLSETKEDTLSERTLTVFEFEGHNLREILVDGIPYFMIADKCKMLELNNVTMVLERLNPLDISQTDVEDTRGHKVLMWVGNEYALYDLILRSEKPNARNIQQWLTHIARYARQLK